MKRELISTTDFVFQQGLHLRMERGMILCNRYANFMKKPLKLGMFIPTDKEGNVLEKRDTYFNYSSIDKCYLNNTKEAIEFREAENRLIFEGLSLSKMNNPYRIYKKTDILEDVISILFNKDKTPISHKTIEDLVPLGLTIKESYYKKLMI